ncbi:MAG: GNAT family N-acetyltransferase [Microthrixaceae bacterium]
MTPSSSDWPTRPAEGPTSQVAATDEALGRKHQTSVRTARVSDTQELDRLRALAAVHISNERGGEVALLQEFADVSAIAELGQGHSSPAHLVLLALISEEIVGYCAAVAVQCSDEFTICQIRELFVESEVREIGIGEMLMDSLTEWALEKGCAGIDATAMPGDRETKNFFETFGLVARAITVHRDLRER